MWENQCSCIVMLCQMKENDMVSLFINTMLTSIQYSVCVKSTASAVAKECET